MKKKIQTINQLLNFIKNNKIIMNNESCKIITEFVENNEITDVEFLDDDTVLLIKTTNYDLKIDSKDFPFFDQIIDDVYRKINSVLENQNKTLSYEDACQIEEFIKEHIIVKVYTNNESLRLVCINCNEQITASLISKPEEKQEDNLEIIPDAILKFCEQFHNKIVKHKIINKNCTMVTFKNGVKFEFKNDKIIIHRD